MPRNAAGIENRELTGPWAGFRFCRGRLISPEGYDFGPEDLRWLSLTFNIKHEWTRLMDAEKAHRHRPRDPTVIYLREVLAGAYERVRACR